MSKPSEKFNIKALRQQADQIQKPDDQVSGQPDEKRVNLCVKVPESWRKHWAIQAKIQEVTMTQVMVDALTQQFGLPDDQMTR